MHTGFRARPWSAAVLISLAGLAACQSAPHTAAQRSVPASRSPLASARATPSGTPTPAAGTDVRACFKGRCRIRVVAPATIPVDSRFGVPSVHISVTGSLVTVAAYPSGGELEDTLTVPGNAAINNLNIAIQALSGNTVTLALSPA